ncbi:MAG: TCR/Tet family MFS transporter [Cohaesibacter sp.]|jgi:DHA1 family tetracycline resistance protein-like MFS transporter|nr:TCR/Tet family MFS transporter [Cohaesibacter sp.]
MSQTPEKNTKAIWFILFTVFLDAMGIGIIMPVLPDLIQDISGTNLGQAAILGGYLSFIYAFMQFLAAPTLGNLSDRYGRRPVLLVSLAMLGLDYIIMGFAPNFALLFIGRLIAGIAGATHSTASAYIADVSAPDKRSQYFGLIGAAFGIGFVAGPIIGGLVAEFGTRAPFFAAAILVLINFFYGLFILPESLAKEKRRPFEWKRANPAGSLLQAMKIPGLLLFFAAFFLYHLAEHVYPSIWVYYGKEAFAWSSAEVGLSLGVFGIFYAAVQAGLIRYLLRIMKESSVALLGLLLNAMGMAGLLFITQSWILFAYLPFTALGGIVNPALQGIMSRSVSEEAQGELQGALASILGVTTILSPLIMTQIFNLFTTPDTSYYHPAGVFGIAAIITLFAIPVLWKALKTHARLR